MKKEIQADLNREIQTLGRSCTSQFQDLQQGVQSAERGVQEVKTAQGSMETRLQALESRGSDAGTVASTAPPGRKAALVLGGWDPDSAAAAMLENAKILVRDLPGDSAPRGSSTAAPLRSENAAPCRARRSAWSFNWSAMGG